MNDSEKEIIYKTDKLSLKEKEGVQQENFNDLDDITPNRGRFFSSMNYKEYVSKFDKPPARPIIMPLEGDPILDNEFSLDSAEQNTEMQMRSYSQSLPMRPFELSGSSSLKSNSDQKTIEEEDEEMEEVSCVEDDPIYPIDQFPQSNEVVNHIIHNNDAIRSRSQSENYSNVSIFNFCQGGRKKQNTIIN